MNGLVNFGYADDFLLNSHKNRVAERKQATEVKNE